MFQHLNLLIILWSHLYFNPNVLYLLCDRLFAFARHKPCNYVDRYGIWTIRFKGGIWCGATMRKICSLFFNRSIILLWIEINILIFSKKNIFSSRNKVELTFKPHRLNWWLRRSASYSDRQCRGIWEQWRNGTAQIQVPKGFVKTV